MSKIFSHLALGALLAGVFVATAAWSQTQGVSKTEVTLGAILDLSGPLAGPSKQARNGMQQRVDEANAKGGIAGRKIKLIVEDNGYDPKKGLLAAQKLVHSDGVFAVLGHIGTAPNMAALPIQEEQGVINFMPLSGAREMFEPPSKLRYGLLAPYFDQMRIMVPYMVKQKGFKRVGILYQDDEFGLEFLRGTEAGLKLAKLPLVEKTSYKRGATDFASQIAKLKAAGCDLVIMGTIIRETVGALAEARKTGFNAAFMGGVPAYNHLIHVLGEKAVEGFYTATQGAHPYPDDQSPAVRDWAGKYKAKYSEDPSVWSVIGYNIVDLFAKAAEKTGANLNADSLAKVMEATVFPRDIFGSPECKMSKSEHLCSNSFRLAQIQNGRWVMLTDYISGD